MALVDILIGIVIGVVGGVVIPAAVLYRYRHRVGQWFIERQAQQTFEEGLDLEGAFAGAGAGENAFDEAVTGENAFDGTGMVEDRSGEGAMIEDVFAGAGAAGDGFEDAGAARTGSNAVDTADDSGGGTRRCDCGELVSPKLDEECPNCGAPVVAE